MDSGDAKIQVYATADHRISGVHQQAKGARKPTFASEHGEVNLEKPRSVCPNFLRPWRTSGGEGRQKWLPIGSQLLLKFLRTVATPAGPGLGPVLVAAVFSRVRVFDAKEFEILLPVRPLLIERRGAEAGFHPFDDAVCVDPRLPHVVEVFVASD